MSGIRTAADRQALRSHAKARYGIRFGMTLAACGTLGLFTHDVRAQSPLDWFWNCSGGWYPNGACQCIGTTPDCPNITFRPTIDFKSTSTGVICSTTGSCTNISPQNLSCAQLTLGGGGLNIHLNSGGTVVGPIILPSGGLIHQESGANLSAQSLSIYNHSFSTWTATGGTVNISGNADIGFTLGVPVTLAVSGGSFNVGGTLRLFGPAVLSGGTLSVGGMTGCNLFSWTGGTFRFTGSELALDGSNCLGSISLDPSRALQTTQALTVPGGADLTLAGGSVSAQVLYLTTGGRADHNSGGVSVVDLNIGERRSTGSTYFLRGGTLNLAGHLFLGHFGEGTFDQSGGSFVASAPNPLVMGSDTTDVGVYNLRSGTYTLTSPHDPNWIWFTEQIGQSGTGIFNQTGGTHNTEVIFISGNNSAYNLSNGILNISVPVTWHPALNVGVGGTAGRFTQTGGESHFRDLNLGLNGSVGTVELSAGLMDNTGYGLVGNVSVGVFRQTGGVHTMAGLLTLGLNAGASGTYELSGTGQLTCSDERIGNNGTGTFTQTGGTNSSSGYAVGLSPGGVGTYNLSGGNLSIADEYVGYSGTGTFNQSGGTNTVHGGGYGGMFRLGRDPGSSGHYSMTNGTLNVTAPFGAMVGVSGTGDFMHTGGTYSVTGTFTVAANAGSVGSYTLNGGLANLNFRTNIGDRGTGMLHVLLGDMAIGEDLNLGWNTGGSGIAILEGGSVTVAHNAYVGTHGTGSVILSGGLLSVQAAESVGYDILGSVTQTGGTHTVTNALTLAANPGSSGMYHLSGGSLSAGSIVINLGGVFDLQGPSPTTTLTTPLITNGGTFSIGQSSAASLATTNFNQTTRGILDVRIDGTAPGQYGQLAVQHANLAGTLSISLGSGYVPAVGDTFDIVTGNGAGSVAGTFANTDLPCGWIVRYGTNYVRVSCASTTFSCPYDVNTSFSTAYNPRGPWSYCVGGAPITTMLPATTGTIGPGWGYNTNYDGSITKARLNDATAFDWRAADLVIHTLSPSLGGTATNFNSIRWTSPSAGAIVITGTAWDAQFAAQRDASWNLVVNGTTIATRPSVFGVHRTDAGASFANNLLPGRSLANIPVLPGQVVELQAITTPTAQYGHFMGVTMQITFCHAGPGFSAGPNTAMACMGGTASFEVMSQGSSIATRWQIELPPVGSNSWVDLADGSVPISGSLATASGTASTTLSLANADPPAGTRYRCRVSNNCGSVVSSPADLTVCVADADDGSSTGACDGGVTIDDLLYYLLVFEAGGMRADVDDGSGAGSRDGGVTIDDLLYYLLRFESGC